MRHHTGHRMTHRQDWLLFSDVNAIVLESRITGSTDSPSASAEGAGRSESQPVPMASPNIC